MKYSPLLLLAFLTTAQAEDNAVRLNCPTRGNITISFFNYHLITMKWGDHFQVAAGKERNHTKAGVAFWSTTFGNGDDLAFFPDSGQYYLFYAGSEDPEPCRETSRFVYPVITPPRYDKRSNEPENQAQTTDNDVIVQRPEA
ncbi:UNVERIFIED_ORG: hypothetical protein J2806_000481 [Kosakonia oryzae]|uniref:Membrane-bound lysozyme-inhibitor of c-type lysozyme n=1 Tax=Kosakonia radicincitans TaxID=283686 RepID=A0AAX2EM29_9ENTR|nr:hypothetical protein [Kosakonia radicincitans]MDP9564848.1 hypothetical protein [Kosakonia oryzae]SFD95023.1 hypothetical protein SAMN03159468_00522 [Kosakonia radicincitans]SFQ98460.1 hypothetical protein SAMN03159514_00521 [Kosakonia radicincitans]SFT42867.1 hypothetical protein SAMN03159428_00520 [Kosakonia radicincitans]SFX12967.1 hypothetical protein SAMN03159436_00519 [Kosakonia radicincitans]